MKNLFMQGLVLGFAIAAPVGPIGILCIRRTLTSGFIYGLLTGLGAATADALYGLVAAFGLTVVSTALVHGELPLRIGGALFLAYLGIQTFIASPQETSNNLEKNQRAFGSTYLSALGLTLTNPATVLSFAAIFAGLGTSKGMLSNKSETPFILVAGLFLGSALWWLILSTVAGVIKAGMTERTKVWINRTSGSILVFFAIAAIWPYLGGKG
jgi:threonine/homoserine/homoserine lactone efflux protein